MNEQAAVPGDARSDFLAFYDKALPHVYGYLQTRCGSPALAEDLTSQTFLAVVDGLERGEPGPMRIPWIIGVARHKLVDHWRRQGREERKLQLLSNQPKDQGDPWDARLDSMRAKATMEELAAQHRAALTFRYLDDLPVHEVADLLGRTVQATEALLVRARAAFRRTYEQGEDRDA